MLTPVHTRARVTAVRSVMKTSHWQQSLLYTPQVLLLATLSLVACSAPARLAATYGNTQQIPPQHGTNCYGFPDQPFTKTSYVSICDPGVGCEDQGLGMQTGNIATNFQLTSTQGTPVELYSLLLQNKPIFVQFGSFT